MTRKQGVMRAIPAWHVPRRRRTFSILAVGAQLLYYGASGDLVVNYSTHPHKVRTSTSCTAFSSSRIMGGRPPSASSSSCCCRSARDPASEAYMPRRGPPPCRSRRNTSRPAPTTTAPRNVPTVAATAALSRPAGMIGGADGGGDGGRAGGLGRGGDAGGGQVPEPEPASSSTDNRRWAGGVRSAVSRLGRGKFNASS